MKALLLIAMCFVFGQTVAQTNKVDEYSYDHAIRWAIREKAANPRDVSFGWAPATYERIVPPVYERKYGITVGGQSAIGYAKVKYNGGDPKDVRNWTVVKSYIER